MNAVVIALCAISTIQVAILLYALMVLRKRSPFELLERLRREVGELGREVADLGRKADPLENERLTDLIAQVDQTTDATYRMLARPMKRELGHVAGIAAEIDSRRREIEGLRKGQQGALFQKLGGEIVRIRRELAASADDERESATRRDIYADVVELIDDHLRAMGAEQRSPKLGSDYRSSNLVADRPKVEFTPDETLDWSIASVESEAWVIDEGEAVTVLQAAIVTIFRLAKS